METPTADESQGTKAPMETPTAVADDPNTTPPPAKADESSLGDNGTMGSPKDETSSVNIFIIPNDSTYASSFDEFMKDPDPYQLMYFFLLRNVEFVIEGNQFIIDIQPPFLTKHIETLFTNNDFVNKLPKEKTNKDFMADLRSVLSNIAKYIEHHIESTLSEEKATIALNTRVKSYRNRRAFFNKSAIQFRKGLDKDVFQASERKGEEEKKEKKTDSLLDREKWEQHIVPLATLAPAQYVFIETCCPYVKQYHIHNIDKAQLLKLMISYLLSFKTKKSLLQGIISTVENLVTKAKDTALVAHMMQTYDDNPTTQKLRYPVFRDFKELFKGTPDAAACAYEYMRIHEIIRTSHKRSDMVFYSVGVTNSLEKEKEKKVYFPHTEVLVGSIAGNILTYSYPFRLDMPTFIYEHSEKNIERFIKENEKLMIAAASEKDIYLTGTWMYTKPDEPAKKRPRENDAEEQNDGNKKPKEGGAKEEEDKQKPPAILNPFVIDFIKNEVLNKLTHTDKVIKLTPIEKQHVYYYANLKNILLQIVKVADEEYTLTEQDLVERTMQGVSSKMKFILPNGVPTRISKERSDVMARLNEAHDMLTAYKDIDVDDKLDLYEVYFNNIKRVLYTQGVRKPGIVEPAAEKQASEKQEAEKQEADKQEAKEPAAEEPVAEKPAADKQEVKKPEAEQPESKAEGTGAPPKDGGSQKKYKFKGRFYNIHEHRSIKYIITKEYGIVPIYS